MDPQVLPNTISLNYPCIRKLVEYLPLKKRLQIEKYIPVLNQVSRKLPIHIGKLRLAFKDDTYYVEIDDSTWEFPRGDGGGDEDEEEGENEDEEEAEDVTGYVAQFLKYAFRRKGTTVGELLFENFPISSKMLKDLQIDHLKFDFKTPGDTRQSVRAFRNLKIRLIEVDFSGQDVDWTREITKIHCDHIKINTFYGDFADFSFAEYLKHVKLLEIKDLYPRNDSFLNTCKNFQTNCNGIGSYYEATMIGADVGTWRQILNDMETDFSSDEFFSAKMENSNAEILGTRFRSKDSPKDQIFRVEIAPAGTGKKAKDHYLSSIHLTFRLFRATLKFSEKYPIASILTLILFFLTMYTLGNLWHIVYARGRPFFFPTVIFTIPYLFVIVFMLYILAVGWMVMGNNLHHAETWRVWIYLALGYGAISTFLVLIFLAFMNLVPIAFLHYYPKLHWAIFKPYHYFPERISSSNIFYFHRGPHIP